MREITDDEVMATADQLVKELDLTEDDRNVIMLGIQRLIWAPSVQFWMHEGEHITLAIVRREDGKGWDGELRCQHGCARRWLVHSGPAEEAVYQALSLAHEEYRTGRMRSVSPRTTNRLRFAEFAQRAIEVEVTDERWTGKG